MKIRTLIVDDEPLARERLTAFLEASPDIEVIGECGDGLQALERIRSERPDLLFLDIQMPELDGFGVVEALAAEVMPVVVFVTAYDRYALKAFEVHAVDYLLKPFDRERFDVALGRAVERVRSRQGGDIQGQLASLLADLRPKNRAPDRLVIKSEGRVLFLRMEEIDWVEASDNYVNLHVGTESHLLRETMGSLESRLPPDRFLRISRSTMVNIERIKELQPMFHGEYTVILRNGTRLTLSRGYRDKLQPLLGKLA
jgi:two-component system LytT family response regulator